MDLREIEKTISELAQGKTTYDACDKLASLLIVRDHLTAHPEEVTVTREAAPEKSVTMEIAKKWTSKMRNEDGTIGAHWNIEQIRQVMAQRGVEYNAAEIFAVMNMLYSDYYKVLKKYGITSADAYLDLALAWINDADVKANKTMLYYECVVKH